MGLFRMDKYLADMGMGTRSEVKEYIRKGRVSVNGVITKAPDTKIDTGKDTVTFDGVLVGYTEYEYFMLNKPQGVVSATEDRRDKTVLDLILTKSRKDLFPVGRLDKDTEGLLLITNDGNLAHELLAPKKHVDKVYYARIDGIVTKSHVAEFSKGIVIDGGVQTMPSELKILAVHEEENVSEIELVIHEGKFHQVKRMFEACGMRVSYLKRLRMGTLVLDENLKTGEYRKLTEQELKSLKGAEQ